MFSKWSYGSMGGQEVMNLLDKQYNKIQKQHAKIQQTATEAVSQYVNELGKKAATTQEAAPSISDGGATDAEAKAVD
jgi:hypothetical protein